MIKIYFPFSSLSFSLSLSLSFFSSLLPYSFCLSTPFSSPTLRHVVVHVKYTRDKSIGLEHRCRWKLSWEIRLVYACRGIHKHYIFLRRRHSTRICSHARQTNDSRFSRTRTNQRCSIDKICSNINTRKCTKYSCARRGERQKRTYPSLWLTWFGKICINLKFERFKV